MAKTYPFKTATGERLIPVADDDFLTDQIDANFSIGSCFLQFFDTDGTTPVTPSGGTINFRSSAFDGQYLESPEGEITATTVIGAGNATYTVPAFDAVVFKSKMTLLGITGASFVRAIHWRDE